MASAWSVHQSHRRGYGPETRSWRSAAAGVLALLACQAGARKVYAVDSEEIVHFARELAAANALPSA